MSLCGRDRLNLVRFKGRGSVEGMGATWLVEKVGEWKWEVFRNICGLRYRGR